MFTLPGRLIGAAHHVARAETRAPAFWRAKLQAGEAEGRILMRNISRSGFMGITATAVRPGDSVTLTLPVGAPVVADVRWALNERIGCRLRGRFDKRQLCFLGICSTANGLLTASGLRTIGFLGIVAFFFLA